MNAQIRRRNLDASIISGLGGMVILYVGLIGLKLTVFAGDTAVTDLSEAIAGTVWGTLILVFSALLFLDTRRSRIYGATIVILSFASWYGTSGGLFLGFVLAFLGGIMGYSWKPVSTKSQIQTPADNSQKS